LQIRRHWRGAFEEEAMLRSLPPGGPVKRRVLCVGNPDPVALRHPREQIRRNLPAGVITSVAVALWFLIG
jgi:hypothetical protein